MGQWPWGNRTQQSQEFTNQGVYWEKMSSSSQLRLETKLSFSGDSSKSVDSANPYAMDALIPVDEEDDVLFHIDGRTLIFSNFYLSTLYLRYFLSRKKQFISMFSIIVNTTFYLSRPISDRLVLGVDQSIITHKAAELMASRIAPFELKMLGVYIEIMSVHDYYGHAFHCTDRIGREKIIFNFTFHCKFKIFVGTEFFHGVVEFKNITSKGEGHELEIKVDHWVNGKGPKGRDLNQAKATLGSNRMKNLLTKTIEQYRFDLGEKYEHMFDDRIAPGK